VHQLPQPVALVLTVPLPVVRDSRHWPALAADTKLDSAGQITITTGLVDTSTTPDLLRMLEAGQLDVGHMVTHRFALDDFAEAYEVFADPTHTGALKVVLTRH
jgi:threonine dehydrogenase-like Zn-dependent dehydrogenase